MSRHKKNNISNGFKGFHSNRMSDEGGSDKEDAILATILKESREIKEQNNTFREETKKELEELKAEMRTRDKKWENDRINMQDSIEEVEIKIEKKMEFLTTRIRDLGEKEEKR